MSQGTPFHHRGYHPQLRPENLPLSQVLQLGYIKREFPSEHRIAEPSGL